LAKSTTAKRSVQTAGHRLFFFLTVVRTAFGGQAIADFASTETADSLRKGCREAKGLVF